MTGSSQQPGTPIAAGYAWSLRVHVASAVPVFPAGCALTAHVRRDISDAAPAAVLTTANGGIVRISDAQIELVLTAVQTAALANAPTVEIDVARTDLPSPAYLGFMLTIPIITPVTRL